MTESHRTADGRYSATARMRLPSGKLLIYIAEGDTWEACAERLRLQVGAALAEAEARALQEALWTTDQDVPA